MLQAKCESVCARFLRDLSEYTQVSPFMPALHQTTPLLRHALTETVCAYAVCCVMWLQKELEQLLDSGAYNDSQEVRTDIDQHI